MSTATASIRKPRSAKLSRHKAAGPVGADTAKTTTKHRNPPVPLPDYMARLLKRQPIPMSEQAVKELWDYERGDR